MCGEGGVCLEDHGVKGKKEIRRKVEDPRKEREVRHADHSPANLLPNTREIAQKESNVQHGKAPILNTIEIRES